jgi:hypothetical protein
MIFNAESPTDLDKVAEYLELPLRAPSRSTARLTLTDALLIQVGCLNAGLPKHEAPIAALEEELAQHKSQKH